MSSVLVKGMSMPTECEYCGFCRFYRDNGSVWCNAKNRVLMTHWEEPDWTHLDVRKPDWCPLVEIKTPHGDLIDSSEIRWVEHHDSDGNLSKYMVAYSDEMPQAVIEAEGET